VVSEAGEAFQHLCLADPAKLPIQHFGELGLWQADDFGCLRLYPAARFRAIA
jgi:hypothetical protein